MRATSNYRFDHNEVNPVLASSNSSKLCYCKPFFLEGEGGGGVGEREGVGGRGLYNSKTYYFQML